MIRRILLVALGVLQLAAWAGEPVQDQGRVGWHFYQDPPPPVEPPVPAKTGPAPAPVTATVVPDARPPELKVFAEMQRRLEEYRNIAIVNPTDDNVRRYMAYEFMVSDKAAAFADAAQRVVWSHPELDAALQGRPITPSGARVYDAQLGANNAKRLREIGKDHALLFFFRSDCPYCHAFAPLLARFQAQYGIRVEAVSLDGGSLPEFAAPRRNNGIAERLGVRQVPALFLAQPFKGEISTVGYGALSAPELEQRVIKVAGPRPPNVSPIDLAQIPSRP